MNYKVSKTTAKYLDSLKELHKLQGLLLEANDLANAEADFPRVTEIAVTECTEKEIRDMIKPLYDYIYSEIQDKIASSMDIKPKAGEVEI